MKRLPLFLILFFLLSCSDSELVNLKQISNGAQLYKTHCSNCHQDNGSGLAELIPPLQHADYLSKNANLLPCLIKNGYKGLMKVNGVEYNMAMPAAKGLTNEEIADITSFVLQKFPENPIHLPDSAIFQQLKNCQ
jgi:mono/diheme cytochrome c family protein